MKRRDFLKLVGTGTLAATLRWPAWAGEAPWAKPNFIFILVDDMGWTALSTPMHPNMADSCSDYYLTPNIAKLAGLGMRFSNAYAPAPMCTPTRASVLTGKSPAQLHMTTPGPFKQVAAWQKVAAQRHVTDLPAAELTIAEILKAQGYATAHFGKWHLAGGGPGKHGFDEHDGETGNGGPGANTDPNPKDIFGITKRAADFMTKHAAADKPFYLQLSHYALHAPVLALDSTRAACAARPKGKRHNNVDYAAMLQDFDTAVGMTLDKVAELGLTGNTYVVFLSDNGAGGRPGSTENAPLSGGKGALSEGGIRVPLIVRGPGVEAGAFCKSNVVGFDLFNTFCELAGVDKALPAGIEGSSLVPLLHGKDAAFQRKHDELVFHFPHYGRGPRQQPQSAIIVGDLKLVKDYDSGQSALYNLGKDLGEQRNLADAQPQDAAAMLKRLEANLKRVGAQLPTVNASYDPKATRPRGGRRPQR